MSEIDNPYWVGYHQGKNHGELFYRWGEIEDQMPEWIAADAWRSKEWRVGFRDGNWQVRVGMTYTDYQG